MNKHTPGVYVESLRTDVERADGGADAKQTRTMETLSSRARESQGALPPLFNVADNSINSPPPSLPDIKPSYRAASKQNPVKFFSRICPTCLKIQLHSRGDDRLRRYEIPNKGHAASALYGPIVNLSLSLSLALSRKVQK